MAKFNYEVIQEISSYTYKFIDISTSTNPIVSYHWDFGDGSTSKLQNPEHQFLENGLYLVSLQIMTADSCSSYYTDTLQVETIIPPGCIAYFTYLRLTGSVDYTVAFSDHSVSGINDTIISWDWDFGDGSYSNAQNPIHQYLNTGIYTVQLVINTKNNCQTSFSHQVQINSGSVACQASFTHDPDTLHNPLKIYFHNNSSHSTPIISYRWYFDDGDSSNLQDPVHTYPYAGLYYVRLKIETQGGCSDEMSIPISVGNPQPYNMWGRVYAGPYVIDQCIAYLYKEYNNNYYKPIDTVRLTSINDTLGVYYFFQIPEGKHKVKVILPATSQYAEDYAPTYYGNDELWTNGSTLQLFQNISMAHVHLEPVVHMNTASGQISGQVVSSSTAIPQPENIEILLYNDIGEIVDYTFTDLWGNFSFDHLDQGQYYITGEVTGLHADILAIQLQNSTDTVSSVTLNLTNKHITGICVFEHEKQVSYSYFPNPVTCNLQLTFEEEIQGGGFYEIFDVQGKKLATQNISEQRMSQLAIEMGDYHQGFYFIRIHFNSGLMPLNFKIVKK
jgi:PKD repeat protein